MRRRHAYDAATEAGYGTGEAEIEAHLDILSNAGASFQFYTAMRIAAQLGIEALSEGEGAGLAIEMHDAGYSLDDIDRTLVCVVRGILSIALVRSELLSRRSNRHRANDANWRNVSTFREG